MNAATHTPDLAACAATAGRQNLLIRCRRCGDNVAAYDPLRCNSMALGAVIKSAVRQGFDVVLTDAPVVVQLAGCDCDGPTPPTL